MKKGILTIVFCIAIGYVFGQSDGDYRSQSSGNWNQTSRWQVFFNGAWRNLTSGAAGPFQNVLPTSASGVITIRSGHTIRVTASTNANQLIIEAGGTLRINASRVLTIIEDGAAPLTVDGILQNVGTLDLQTQLTTTPPCQINGTLQNNSLVQVSNPLLLVFNSGSTYQHLHRTGGIVPSATWSIGSTCLIAGNINKNGSPPTNLGQSFWHFTWNTPTMSASSNFSLNGALQTVNGNLTFVNTGNRVVRLDNAGPGYNLTIGGNFLIQDGLVTLAQAQTSATAVTIGGNLDISGGTLTLGTSNNSAIDVLLNGNFQKTGGVISRGSGTGAGTIRFDGGIQTYTNNAAITNAVNFSVESGSNLNLGIAFLTGTGTFALNAGGTVQVGSIDAGGAIQVGTAGGNIRVSGVRTYQANSDIIYNGVGGQFMASGHPAAPNTTIFNPANVVLLSDITIGSLLVDEGAFVAGNHAVNITRNLVVDDELQAGTSTFTFSGGVAQAISATSPLTLFNVAVNQSPASTLTVASALDIENEIAVNSASTVAAGNNLLRLLSTPTRTANVAPILGGGSINGTVIVQRHLPKAVAANSFFYMGSPVTNSSLADWDVELPIKSAHRWNEPTRNYVQYSLAGALPSGLGLAVRVNSTATFTTDVSGTLRQGPISVNVTSQSPVVDSPDGWNLIGNPYPSAIDWDNITQPAGIYNAMYITDNFNNSGQGTGIQRVSYVDGVGTPASYGGEIAQGQAFWVKATASTSLDFTESAKIPNTDTQFYRKGEVPNVLRIAIEGQGLEDEAVLRLRDGATLKFDGRYDAEKFFADEFKLTTVTSDNIKTAINAIGTGDCSAPVPLSIEGAAPGQYQFSFNGIESFEGNIGIVLEDALENKTIDIGTEKVYSFTITEENVTTLASRFRIKISAPVINTLVNAVGERVCGDNDTALITVKDSEKGVHYSATWNGEKVSTSEIGTGSNIELTINTNNLEDGENKITVWASSGLCSSQVALIESPVISKVKTYEINSVLDGAICNEGTTSLTATGVVEGGFYNWYEDLDSDEPIISEQEGLFVTPTLTKTKTYYVAAVNSLCCEGARVPIKAVVSYAENVSLTMLDDVTLKSSHESGNTWYLNDNLISEGTSGVLVATEPGMYTLKVDQGGCITSASREISETEFEGGTNVEPTIKIYPNPTQNKLYVRVRSKNEIRAVIFSSTGVEMVSKNLIGNGEVKEGEFDLLSFTPGIYNITIVDGSKQSVKKIAKVN